MTNEIDKKYIEKNIELANQWKIFISKANGAAGLLGDEGPVSILGKPYIGSPQTICSDSLIPIGGFETEEEALNLAKYIKTKFLRFMVGILKVSQNTTQIVYRLVPLQNFTSDSDINWENSIEEIDEQLFDKYELTEEDRDYINNSIKEMD